MLHVYTGEGKGKTTAAAGAALRAAGHGIPVLFMQFLKDGSSGETRALMEVKGVTVRTASDFIGFVSKMSEEEKEGTRAALSRLLPEVRHFAGLHPARALIVLDEAVTAVQLGLIPEETLLSLSAKLPEETELILTGRGASGALCSAADYLTVFVCGKHPYARGVRARCGIEW